MEKEIKIIIWILAAIVAFMAVIALFYVISVQRRRAITWKKIDYLVEDLTYKSEMLTSTVETVAKISNYIDVFEVFARKNIRSFSRVLANNKDDIYKILNRIKKITINDSSQKNSKKVKGDN